MFKSSVFKVLVAATLLAAVLAKPFDYEPVLSSFFDLPSLDIVIGDYVEGARILQEDDINKGPCYEGLCDFTETFVFPVAHTSQQSLGLPVTKVVVLVEKTNDEETAEVKVVKGGIKTEFIQLEIKVNNAEKLHYKVVVFGPPWN